MGIKRLISLFPEITSRQLTLEEVRNQGNVLFESDKHNKLIQNFLTGVTKLGVFGDEFFEMNNKMVCLDNPIVTEEAKEGINALINDTLDTEGRSYKNTMKMMMEDGLFLILPKSEDAWIKFLNQLKRIRRLNWR